MSYSRSFVRLLASSQLLLLLHHDVITCLSDSLRACVCLPVTHLALNHPLDLQDRVSEATNQNCFRQAIAALCKLASSLQSLLADILSEFLSFLVFQEKSERRKLGICLVWG